LTAELRLILTWAATVALLLIVDCFGPLSRLLFERPGDGTRFVLPPAYIAGTVTVEMLMLSALNLFGDILEVIRAKNGNLVAACRKVVPDRFRMELDRSGVAGQRP